MAASRNIDVTKKIFWLRFLHPSPVPLSGHPLSPLLVAGCNDYDTKWGFILRFGVGHTTGGQHQNLSKSHITESVRKYSVRNVK